GCGQEHADALYALALLRARRERPRCRSAAEQRDELAALHVEHGGLPPLCAISPPTGPCSVFRTCSLPQGGLQVLGANLKCSESRCQRASCSWRQQGAVIRRARFPMKAPIFLRASTCFRSAAGPPLRPECDGEPCNSPILLWIRSAS